MDFVRIDREALPPEELEAAEAIENNLVHLHNAAQEFRNTLELYLHAHDRKLARQDDPFRMIAWINIAGRNGAIVAYGVGAVMEAINKAPAPAIWSKADMAQREAGAKLYAAEFSAIAGIRNAAAHPGELSKDVKSITSHRMEGQLKDSGLILDEGMGGLYLSGGMEASKDSLIYSSTFKGRHVKYELSARKAEILARVATHYSRVFYPLSLS